MKKTILSLLVALMATTGAWADNKLYLDVSGTTATLKYGEAGDKPYYTEDDEGAPWEGLPSASDIATISTIYVDASCSGYTGTILTGLFASFSNTTTITGLENLGISNVTNMTAMFYYLRELTEVDLSTWNTVGVTDMAVMFLGCEDLETIYVGDGWNVENVESSESMFYNCTSLPGFNSSYIDKTKAHTGDGGYLTYKTAAPAGPATSGITWNVASNSGTFLMPAYDVEVSTELWYILKQNGETPAANKSKTDVFLERTLSNSMWSTFCAPFNAAIPEGWTVKEFTGSDYNASTQTLTLDFNDASSIVAGTPYLVKADVDGPTFDGVTQDWTANNPVTPSANGGYATFVPVLTPTTINGKGFLYLGGNNTLYYPSGDVNVNGFRAYFQLNNGLTAGDLPNGNNARAFVLNIDGEQTGIRSLTPDASPKGEGSIYSLDGRKVQNTTRKGVYIVNGKKVVIK